MASKMARADAGHLARCVQDDYPRLKGSQNRVVDIWASDCLSTESLGLLSAGINPFILPHQTGRIVFHRARIRTVRACQVALFKSLNGGQIWVWAAAAPAGGQVACDRGAEVCPTGGAEIRAGAFFQQQRC